MADQQSPATLPPVAAPAAAVTLPAAVETPAVAPAAAAPPVPSPVSQETIAEKPAETRPAPVAETKPAESAPVETPKTPEPVAEQKSLLGEIMQKPAEKPAEVKPEVKPEPIKVEPVKYEAFKFPEGIVPNDQEVGKYTSILAQHQVPQDAAQQLIDLYTEELKRREQLVRDTWSRTREGWVSEVKSDPEIGGSRHETTLQRCAAVLDQYAQAAGAERAQKLKTVLGFTGAGDHPELIRFVNWAAGFTVERARPVAAVVPKAPQPVSRAQRRYANPAFSTGAN